MPKKHADVIVKACLSGCDVIVASNWQSSMQKNMPTSRENPRILLVICSTNAPTPFTKRSRQLASLEKRKKKKIGGIILTVEK